MIDFLKILLLYGIFYPLSILLTVALFLLSVYLKKRIQRMNEEKWDAYFAKLSLTGFLTRFYLLYGMALFSVGLLAYYLFSAMDFLHPVILSVLFFVLGIIFQIRKYALNKERLVDKFQFLMK